MNYPTRIRRKDASERRERLIEAAVELFGSEGFDVPLEKIAARAGVSRPTLYRNFPDRESISVTVQRVLLEEVGATVARWSDRDDAFLLALKMMAERTLRSGGFEKLLATRRSPEVHTEFFEAGVAEILGEPLERAKTAGLVRQDFPVGQIGMAILLLSAAALARPLGDEASLDRGLALLMSGLAPRPAGPAAG